MKRSWIYSSVLLPALMLTPSYLLADDDDDDDDGRVQVCPDGEAVVGMRGNRIICAVVSGEGGARIIALDGFGAVIGDVIGFGKTGQGFEDFQDALTDPINEDINGPWTVAILTEEGFVSAINRTSGDVESRAAFAGYQLPDCMGAPLPFVAAEDHGPGEVLTRFVQDAPSAFYIPADALPLDVLVASVSFQVNPGLLVCTDPNANEVVEAYEVFDNDLVITGIPNEGFDGPVTMVRQ